MSNIKNYKIIEIIKNNKHESNVIYLATDLINDKKVIIKRGKLAFKEFNILQKLEHPNIVKTGDFIEDIGKNKQGDPRFVVEYIEGETLDSYKKKNTPFKEDDIKALFLPLFNAINYINSEHKLVHNDITTHNIMICKKDHSPIIIDFDISYQYRKYHKFTNLFMRLARRTRVGEGDINRYKDYKRLAFVMLRCVAPKLSEGEYNYRERIAKAAKDGYSESLLKMIKKTIIFPKINYYDEWVEVLSDKEDKNNN